MNHEDTKGTPRRLEEDSLFALLIVSSRLRGALPRARAFTLIELLIGLALLSAALSLAHYAFFGGGRAYARARARMDLISSCRAVLGRVEADVRRTASSVRVSDDGVRLELRVLQTGPDGLPASTPDGRFLETSVVYRFDAAGQRVLRSADGAEETVGRGLPDVVFCQRVLEIGAVKVPAVTARVTAIVDDRPFGIESTAVPRLIAGWAADPAWIFTTIGRPYDFKVDQ